jgi:type I restriction enzyme, S subunit
MAAESAVIHIPSTVQPLPADWRWERLNKVCEDIFDCPHSTPVLTVDGPFLVRSQDMRTGVFRMEEAGHVSEDTYQERIVRAEPRYGDLLYSREGTYFGIAAEVPAGVRLCLGQRMVLLRPKGSKCNHRFLRYWLNSPVMASHTHGHRDGTVAERLNLPTIRQLPVAVPPLPEQRAIGHILGPLDDKIELNRRMNETLQAMARALFKSWFVDFDPVRAKTEGRNSGMPKPLADLFPDSFGDSELGDIPKGWETGPFAGTIEILGGGTPKTSSPRYWNGVIPWFSVVDAPSDTDVWVIDTEKKITQAGVEDSSTQILPVGTTIITARGTVGRIALVGVPMAMNQSCYGVRGKTDIHGYYTYFATRQLVSSLQQRAHGSVFDTITRNTFAGVSVVIPPPHLVEAFEKVVSPTLERIRADLFASSSFVSLRDTLLPKLISGELRIKGVERIIGKNV